MTVRQIRLGCSGGLFLIPAGEICKRAMQYRCKSELVIGEKSYNLRSVLSVLSAQVNSTQNAFVRCDGTDEEDAVSILADLLERLPTEQSAEQP